MSPLALQTLLSQHLLVGYIQGLNSLLLLSSESNDRKALLYFKAVKMIDMGPSHLAYYFKMFSSSLIFFSFAKHYFNGAGFAQVFYSPAKYFIAVFSNI